MLWSEQRFTSCLLGNGVCSFPPPLLPVRISIPNEVRNSVPVSLWRASMMTVQTNWTGTLLCHKHADVEWMSGSKTLSALRNKKGHVLQWKEQNSMRNLRFNKNPFDDFKWNPAFIVYYGFITPTHSANNNPPLKSVLFLLAWYWTTDWKSPSTSKNRILPRMLFRFLVKCTYYT